MHIYRYKDTKSSFVSVISVAFHFPQIDKDHSPGPLNSKLELEVYCVDFSYHPFYRKTWLNDEWGELILT